MKYSLENDQWTVQVKADGAELCSVVNKESGREYIWQADPSVWARHAPVLFPIVGRLRDDQFQYNEQTYRLTQHGFARDREFSLVEQEPGSLSLGLTADHQSMEHYPFNFVFDIRFQLTDNMLTVDYNVQNKDQKNMPFSLGAHPAFTMPKIVDKKSQEYLLEFDKPETLERYLIKDGLQTGKTYPLMSNESKLALHPKLFEEDAIIFKGHQSSSVSLLEQSGGQKLVEMSVKGFPYLGIWQKYGADFICIEPWFGVADHQDSNGDIMAKEGIQLLEPEGHFSCNYYIRFY